MLNRKFLTAASVLLAFGLLAPAQNAAAVIDLGVFDGGGNSSSSRANGVSADGSVIVGYSDPSETAFATKFDKATNTKGALLDLSTITAGASVSYAKGVSADGSVIVGDSDTGVTQHAFAIIYNKADNTKGTMIDLGALGVAACESRAYAVSADGSVIVGWSELAPIPGSRRHAFAITFDKSKPANGSMLDLGSFDDNSAAYAVSADGSVIVGGSGDSGIERAFVITYNKVNNTAGMMIDLGAIGGDGFYSSATGVSADGSVIVGTSDRGGAYRAFVIKFNTSDNTKGPMLDLGVLGTDPGFESWANAVSADGSVIVGNSFDGNDQNAFAITYDKATNTAGEMVNLGALISGNISSNALAVSADGSIIAGQFYNGTSRHAVLWVDPFTDPYMVDATEWMQSISGPSGILPIVTSLTSMPMEGAHHRPLITLDAMGKTSQAWVTGDFGARSRTSDSHTTTGEAGISHTFGNVLAGLAVGYGVQNNDLLFDGASHVSGQYILGEIDAKLSDNQGIISLTTMFGSWKSDTLRGYGIQSGLTDYSQGSTNLNSASVRLRFDGPSHKLAGGPFVTPFASFTWTRVAAEAYNESGGSFDAQFDAQEHQSREVRLGLSSKFLLSDKTTLLATAEWIHRFDKTESGFSGTDIDHNALPFDVAGAAITANQARFGLDVDHKLTPNTMLNFSVHAAGVGPSADVSGALSIRRAF